MRQVLMVPAEHIEPRARVLGARGRVSAVHTTTTQRKDRSVEIDFVCFVPGEGMVFTHDCLAFEDELAVLA